MINFQCPHCGLPGQADDRFAGQTGPCRRCGRPVTVPRPAGIPSANPYQPSYVAGGPACPRCGGQSLSGGPWPWYLGTLGAIFMKAVVCNQCGHHFDARKPQADLGKRKLFFALLINGLGALGILTVFCLLGLLVYSLSRT